MLFLASDTHLITTGGRDFCILQWSVEGHLPALNEEEESEIETGMPRVARQQKRSRKKFSDNKSNHSGYSSDERNECEDFSENTARQKQPRGQRHPRENRRYSDEASGFLEVPPGRGRPSRKSQQYNSDNSRVSGRSPQRNIPSQNSTRSQQGSYAGRFHKQKAARPSNQPPPDDMDYYSDEEIPRMDPGARDRERGGERNDYPTRGQGRKLNRRPMR